MSSVDNSGETNTGWVIPVVVLIVVLIGGFLLWSAFRGGEDVPADVTDEVIILDPTVEEETGGTVSGEIIVEDVSAEAVAE